MFSPPRAFRIGALFAVVFAAIVVANCGGGGGSSTPAVVATATPTAGPTGTAGPTSAAGATAAPTSVAATVALNTTTTFSTVAGIAQTLAFPGAPNPAGVTYSTVSYNYAPPTAVPTNMPTSQPTPGNPLVVVYALTFTSATSVTVQSPTQTFTGVPSLPAGKGYYTYFADITAGASQGYNGPQNQTNGTVVFAGGGGSQNSTTLTGGHTYVIELVYF
jgi:hypothetical protein